MGEEQLGPIDTLHKLLDSLESLLLLDSHSLMEYKPLMLKVKAWLQILQSSQSSFSATAHASSTRSTTVTYLNNLTPEQNIEYEQLKAEKANLQSQLEELDSQLFALLSQLKRLQFTIDCVDPTSYQQI